MVTVPMVVHAKWSEACALVRGLEIGASCEQLHPSSPSSPSSPGDAWLQWKLRPCRHDVCGHLRRFRYTCNGIELFNLIVQSTTSSRMISIAT
eukprot:COSAG05_NODE_895_length_6700_cov_14.354189_5_plen_93_part_00